MFKSLKIVLSVLALISIGFSLAIVFNWNPLQKIKTGLTPVPTPTPTPLVEEETLVDLVGYPELKEMPTEDKNALARPVDEKYFESALIDEESPQVLSFFLDPDEPIKAVFKGKIKSIFRDQKPFPEDNAFDEVILDREDGQFYASYVIFGEVLVEDGDIIEQGQVIAKAKEGGLGFRSMTNLSLWIHDKNSDFVELSKEMFTK
jgi:hypothetical protein